jgi:alanine dehydrogenase
MRIGIPKEVTPVEYRVGLVPASVREAVHQAGRLRRNLIAHHTLEPTYTVNEVVHYCVANMPGAAARTSAFALNNATPPFTLEAVARAASLRRSSGRAPGMRGRDWIDLQCRAGSKAISL